MSKQINKNLILLILLFKIVFIISTFEPNSKNVVIFPLKIIKFSKKEIEEEESKDQLGLIINKIVPNNLNIQIKINYHKRNLPGYLTFSSQYSYLGIDSCIQKEDRIIYDILSYIEELPKFTLFSNIYQKYFHLKENITLSINNNNKYNEEFDINQMDLIIPEENERKAKCLIIGLNPIIKEKNEIIFKNFPSYVKSNNKYKNLKTYLTVLYNHSYKDNIKLFNKDDKNGENDGLLIIGEPPHIIYPDLFDINNYKEISNFNSENDFENYYSKSSKQNSWSIKIDNIFYDNKNTTDKKYIGIFSIDYIPFLLPMELFNNYVDLSLNDYINKNICYKKGRPLTRKFTHTLHDDKRQIFIFIYCEKNKIKNISNFYESMPSLKLYNNFLKKNFEFNGKELFLEDDEYTYLMLIPDMFNKNMISLGRIFMEKYLFTFNYDTNKIGFYDKKINEKEINKIFVNNFSFIIFLIFFLIIFSSIIILFLNYNIIKKKNNINNKRKRHNDIDKSNEKELIEFNEYNN